MSSSLIFGLSLFLSFSLERDGILVFFPLPPPETLKLVSLSGFSSFSRAICSRGRERESRSIRFLGRDTSSVKGLKLIAWELFYSVRFAHPMELAVANHPSFSPIPRSRRSRAFIPAGCPPIRTRGARTRACTFFLRFSLLPSPFPPLPPPRPLFPPFGMAVSPPRLPQKSFFG